MNLRKLVNNQTITIDDHKWGAKEIRNWDVSSTDIHIEKKTNYKLNGKKQQVKIKLPINSKRDITIEPSQRDNLEQIPSKLAKEIKTAFSKEKLKKAFIKDLIYVLTDFNSNLDNLEKVKDAVFRISKHFDLNLSK